VGLASDAAETVAFDHALKSFSLRPSANVDPVVAVEKLGGENLTSLNWPSRSRRTRQPSFGVVPAFLNDRVQLLWYVFLLLVETQLNSEIPVLSLVFI
jgi:hypothetical protein